MRLILAFLAALLLAPAAYAQNTYKVKPGDVLQIEVLEDASLNRNALVLPDGKISFPLVGTIQAGGLSVDQIRNNLAGKLASNFATSPNVFVSLNSVAKRKGGRGTRTISIYALGEVAKPGEQKVKRGTTLLQFLSQTGGFTKFAATKRVQIRRHDKRTGKDQVFTFNYNAVERGTSTASFGRLQDGDVIIVPQRRLFE